VRGPTLKIGQGNVRSRHWNCDIASRVDTRDLAHRTSSLFELLSTCAQPSTDRKGVRAFMEFRWTLRCSSPAMLKLDTGSPKRTEVRTPKVHWRMRILAISGSLRASSSNTALLKAAIAVTPQGVDVSLYEGLGDLPHFNQDLDGEAVPQSVKDWRSSLRAADGLVFSIPEYAHGVPGTLKNGLDWVVGGDELVGKPVTLFNASPRGAYAQASLTETLTVMSAKVVSEASVTLQLLGRPFTADQIAADPDMSAALRSAIGSFVAAIDASRRGR